MQQEFSYKTINLKVEKSQELLGNSVQIEGVDVDGADGCLWLTAREINEMFVFN